MDAKQNHRNVLGMLAALVVTAVAYTLPATVFADEACDDGKECTVGGKYVGECGPYNKECGCFSKLGGDELQAACKKSV